MLLDCTILWSCGVGEAERKFCGFTKKLANNDFSGSVSLGMELLSLLRDERIMHGRKAGH